jgi:hypothetical protein
MSIEFMKKLLRCIIEMQRWTPLPKWSLHLTGKSFLTQEKARIIRQIIDSETIFFDIRSPILSN